MASDYQWKPIEDLPDHWQSLTDSELPAICQVLADFKALDEGAFQFWAKKAHREWAIETGRVEGVYQFDRGVTETLMERGILPDLIPRKGNSLEPEQIAAIIQDAMYVLDGLFAFVQGERPLSKSYIHELHQALLRNIDTYRVIDSRGEVQEHRLEKGVYKRYANSVKVNGGTHEYCPVEHVEAEMDRLIDLHGRHADVAPEVSAAWLHHRFTQIHPYPDGNGRVARALATLVLLKHRCFPLIIRTEARTEYYDALLAADGGNLAPLVEGIRALQGDELIGLSQVAMPPLLPEMASLSSVSEVIEAIRRDEYNRGDRHPKQWRKLGQQIGLLFVVATARMKGVQKELLSAVPGKIDPNSLQAPALKGGRGSVTLFFDRVKPMAVEFSIADVGEKPRGLGQAVLAFTDGTPRVDLARRFLITYAETQADVEARFNKWLEAGLVAGLQKWRATLTA